MEYVGDALESHGHGEGSVTMANVPEIYFQEIFGDLEPPRAFLAKAENGDMYFGALASSMVSENDDVATVFNYFVVLTDSVVIGELVRNQMDSIEALVHSISLDWFIFTTDLPRLEYVEGLIPLTPGVGEMTDSPLLTEPGYLLNIECHRLVDWQSETLEYWSIVCGAAPVEGREYTFDSTTMPSSVTCQTCRSITPKYQVLGMIERAIAAGDDVGLTPGVVEHLRAAQAEWLAAITG